MCSSARTAMWPGRAPTPPKCGRRSRRGAMAPVNQARRDRLADAAIEVLARLGARGLTHRAVDAEAGEPPGTTSRYFRTREALMSGVAQRIRQLHFADLQGD